MQRVSNCKAGCVPTYLTHLQVQTCEQRLSFGGKSLDPSCVVSAYNIVPESTLNLTCRLRAGIIGQLITTQKDIFEPWHTGVGKGGLSPEIMQNLINPNDRAFWNSLHQPTEDESDELLNMMFSRFQPSSSRSAPAASTSNPVPSCSTSRRPIAPVDGRESPEYLDLGTPPLVGETDRLSDLSDMEVMDVDEPFSELKVCDDFVKSCMLPDDEPCKMDSCGGTCDEDKRDQLRAKLRAKLATQD